MTRSGPWALSALLLSALCLLEFAPSAKAEFLYELVELPEEWDGTQGTPKVNDKGQVFWGDYSTTPLRVEYYLPTADYGLPAGIHHFTLPSNLASVTIRGVTDSGELYGTYVQSGDSFGWATHERSFVDLGLEVKPLAMTNSGLLFGSRNDDEGPEGDLTDFFSFNTITQTEVASAEAVSQNTPPGVYPYVGVDYEAAIADESGTFYFQRWNYPAIELEEEIEGKTIFRANGFSAYTLQSNTIGGAPQLLSGSPNGLAELPTSFSFDNNDWLPSWDVGTSKTLTSVNEQGEVVGYSRECEGDCVVGQDTGVRRAFLWLPAAAYGIPAGYHFMDELDPFTTNTGRMPSKITGNGDLLLPQQNQIWTRGHIIAPQDYLLGTEIVVTTRALDLNNRGDYLVWGTVDGGPEKLLLIQNAARIRATVTISDPAPMLDDEFTLSCLIENLSDQPFTVAEIDAATLEAEESEGGGLTEVTVGPAGMNLAPGESYTQTITYSSSVAQDIDFSLRAVGFFADGTANRSPIAAAETVHVKGPIIVNDDGDDPDADPDDGVLDTDPDTPGRQVTLRAAITEANTRPGPDSITFSIPSTGIPVISPENPLPAITEELEIDGFSQPGPNCINISGLLGPLVGLAVDASDVTLRGLMVTNCATAGIAINSGSEHVVEGCLIGTDAAGTSGLGNGIGIQIRNATNSLVGGTTEASRNVISGNTTGIDAAAANGLKIASNFLGTAPDGETPLSVTQTGIRADGCAGLLVGVTELATVLHAQLGVLISNCAPGGEDREGANVENVNFNVNSAGDASMGTWMQTALCVEDSENVNIGGVLSDLQNVIGGINGNAIEILRSKKVKVKSNRIGLGRFGSIPLDVLGIGVLVEEGEDVTVGTPELPTLFNANIGVLMRQFNPPPGAPGGLLQNLNFNLDSSGLAQLANSMQTGICVEDSSNVDIGGILENLQNAFAGMNGNAIEILRSKKVKVKSNRIGLGRFGSIPLDVLGIGVLVEEGEDVTVGTPELPTLFNANIGVLMRQFNPPPGAPGGLLQNLNFNLDSSGLTQLANSMQTGICVEDSSNVDIGGILENLQNAFAGMNGNAIEILRSKKVKVKANRIGLGRFGSIPLDVLGIGVLVEEGEDVTVGTPELPTLFNANIGVLMRQFNPPPGAPGGLLQNLNFNLDSSGLAQLANSMQTGICVEDSNNVDIGGTLKNLQNAFAATSGNAIESIRSTGVAITGNRIGVARTGETAFATGGDSVFVDGPGSDVSITGNAIQNALGAGVNITTPGSNVVVRQNRIINCLTSIQRTFHQASSAIISALRGSTHVDGTVSGSPGETLTIDFYAYNPTAPSPELDLFIGTATVLLDPSGIGTYNEVFPATAPLEWALTNTVTSDSEGTTALTTPIVIAPPLDTDGDDFPDAYEDQYPDIFDAATPDDPDIDSDMDGKSDREEFELGTDPTDGDDSIVGMLTNQASGFDVEVRATGGRRYTLERLNEGAPPATWQTLTSTYAPLSGPLILTDTAPPADRALYRVTGAVE